MTDEELVSSPSGLPAEIRPVPPEPEITDDSAYSDDVEEDDDAAFDGGRVAYRGTTNDPIFGYLIAIALSIGLSPLIASGNGDFRYTIAWGVLALFGVTAWLFGSTARIEQETPENIIWGISFGLILSLPMVAFGGITLETAVERLFGMMTTGTILAYLLFVIPISETLFFRGILQENRPFWLIGLMSTFWSIVLYFPLLDLVGYPMVAVVISIVLLMMNEIYGYVRERNGLAAAWICQIVVNLVLIFWTVISS